MPLSAIESIPIPRYCTTPVTDATDADMISLRKDLADKYYTGSGHLRTSVVLLKNLLINVDLKFIDPFTKEEIEGPIVTRCGVFIKPGDRSPPAQLRPISYGNMTTDKRNRYASLTSVQQQQAPSLSNQAIPGPSTPTAPYASSQLAAAAAASRHPATLEELIIAVRNSQMAETDAVSNSGIRNVLSRESSERVLATVYEATNESFERTYLSLVKVPYNGNTTLFDMVARMKPDLDKSHVVCMRPTYGNNDMTEFACIKIVALLIMHAKESVRISSYQWKSNDIIRAVNAVAMKQLDVQLFLDRNVLQKSVVLESLAASRLMEINVMVNCQTKGIGIHHDKVVLLDDSVVLTGSFNFSSNAETGNYENFVVSTDLSVVRAFRKRFEQLEEVCTPFVSSLISNGKRIECTVSCSGSGRV